MFVLRFLPDLDLESTVQSTYLPRKNCTNIWLLLRERGFACAQRASYAAVQLRSGKFLISDHGPSLFGISPHQVDVSCVDFLLLYCEDVVQSQR